MADSTFGGTRGALLVGVVLGLQGGGAVAQKADGLYFSHGDWELACDNTRTCRAAGYHRDEATQRISVLLTRAGGPGAPVTGQLALGEPDEETTPPARLPSSLTLRINGQTVGTVAARGTQAVPLPAPQVAALLKVLPKSSDIRWEAGQQPWILSDRGAAAVLLKMDEYQGRLNTPGALMRPGTRDEQQVPAALPAPLLQAATLPPTTQADRDLGRRKPAALKDALRRSLKSEDNCDLDDPDQQAEPWAVWRLSSHQLALVARCWSAAYNMGSGLWVVQDRPPYTARLVTADATEWEGARASSGQKGRGLGDCWSQVDWVWDGRQFQRALDQSTGLCKLMAAGGVWALPTWVTDPGPRR